MPQAARNINTDGPMTIGDSQKLFDAVPSALKHFQHHDHEGRKRDGRRVQFNNDDQELRERIEESLIAEGRLGVEYEKMGLPFKTNEKGVRVEIDWRAPFRTERAQWKAAIEANAHARKKIGPNVADALKNFCATTRYAWREVEMPNIADERNPLEIIRSRDGELVAIMREERDVQNANRTDAEIEKSIRADYARRKIAGAPKFGSLTQGGIIRHNGQFSPSNPGARPQFPAVAAMVHSGEAHSIFVEVDDALNFVIWADDDEKILAKLLKAAREANADKRTISEADKTKMLRDIAVEKLAAQRHLEVAYRHAEAQGIEIKRRELPPDVLLWLERDTATHAAPTKVSKIEPVEDFEDEGRDE